MHTIIGVIFVITLSLGISNIAEAQPPSTDPGVNPPVSGDPPATPSNATPGEEDDISTCQIEYLGWILCPVINTAAKVGDEAFGFLARNFLETQPELVATDSGTRDAWELARNMANILFIAAFLIIILSQVTGRGIDNYGIKKTLPRLIIAAIAVNVSFFICQAMVDLSNILGYEIQAFLVDIARDVSDRTAMPAHATGIRDYRTGNGFLGTAASLSVAIPSYVWVILPILMLGVGTVVITCIVVLIILLLRKAIIVLLVVLSPIAFVAYLLPNTERYFQKWLGMFWKLLMLFPVVALLFGGGQLASAIVLVAGANNDTDRNNIYNDGPTREQSHCIILPSSQAPVDSNNNGVIDEGEGTGTGAQIAETCGEQSVPVLLGLVAAGIAVAPLLAVWNVLKGALSAAGAIGGKISGAVETYTGKSVGKVGDGYKKTAFGRGREARKAIKQNYKDQKFAERMSGGKGPRSRYTRIAARGIAGNVGRVPIAPGSWKAQDTKLDANFAGAAQKIEDQEVSEKQSAINARTHGDMTEIEKILENASKTGDELAAKAAQNLLLGMGQTGVDHAMAIVGSNEKAMGTKMAEALQTNIRLKHPGIKSSSVAADRWATSNPAERQTDGTIRRKTFDEIRFDASTYRNISADHMNGQTADSLDAIQRSLATASTGDRARIKRTASDALIAKSHEGVKTGNKEKIEHIAT
tara:strand:+ start:12998 stop:15091 length:2094 start_codon:yes stop_codon:yes gene_type:complete